MKFILINQIKLNIEVNNINIYNHTLHYSKQPLIYNQLSIHNAKQTHNCMRIHFPF